MNRKTFIRRLLYRRRNYLRTAKHARWEHHRARAKSKLEVIEWALQELGVRGYTKKQGTKATSGV